MKRLVRTTVLILLAASAYATDFYKVEVTRVGQDLYKDSISDSVIRTRYCYEYVYHDDAILIWDAPSNHKLVFSSGTSCEVRGISK